MDTITQVATAMREMLTTTANALARSTGFVQRTSKLTGAGFVKAWVFACMAFPMPTWEDVSQSAATVGVAITAQWKCHGHVDESRGTQPWRVLCEVYAKLLAVLISHWVLFTERWAYPHRSLVKAAQLIQKHAFHLASSMWELHALENALNVIRDGLRACCRMNTRQKHPNTYQLLIHPGLVCLA
jgi:hypothetical protein